MYSQVIGHKKTLSNCVLMKICTQIYEGLSKPKKKKFKNEQEKWTGTSPRRDADSK